MYYFISEEGTRIKVRAQLSAVLVLSPGNIICNISYNIIIIYNIAVNISMTQNDYDSNF